MSSFQFSEEEYQNVLTFLTDIDYKTSLLIKHLSIIYEKDKRMAFDIATIVAAAQKEKDLIASVRVAFTTLNAKLTDLSNQITVLTANQMDDNTKAQLQSVADQLNASNVDLDALTNAVVANTPVSTTTDTPAPVTTDPVTPPVATGPTDTTTPTAPAVDPVTTTSA